MKPAPSEYILGTSDEELRRLGFQHQVWQDEARMLWGEAGFSSDQRILDLGCGPGFAALELAHLVGPGGQVIAVDASVKYLEFLEREIQACGVGNIQTHRSDVHQLDFADASLDGVFARWLISFVKDPQQVISESCRVLRPGAALVVIDYFNYHAVKIYPPRESFRKLFEAFYESVWRHGGSYDIGAEAVQMICRCGLKLISLKPICRVAQPGSPEWQWFIRFKDSHVPKLVEQGQMSESESEQLERDLSEVTDQPSTFFVTPPMIGIVANKVA